MDIVKRVTALAEEKIAELANLFLVEVRMLPGNKLIILVDGDDSVTISDCAAISRYVGFHLEEEQVIDTAYNLEVGSPGVGEPLKLKRQYVKNIGRKLSVQKKDGSKLEGNLLEVNEDHIVIAAETKPEGKSKSKKTVIVNTSVAFEDITETKVLISFK
ncbi:ribosome assembly cofactor RimP [Pedobacter flavus]|uniref:Ribosome maturation factor RimP n=1 Tax=Pedobacter flavus TaxID=3113906 RepID=A0ABU7GZ53_9SPHI|nr:ribosome assembly cofactor RimP [Pedobacter sp. VNH31]MEE1884304.1 ribosome assembly cofactor RimP [Pedobacter sp. VNH31]